MDWNIIFLILTMMLFLGTSIAVYLRPSLTKESDPDLPLLCVVVVQELMEGPPASMPKLFQQLDQRVLKEQLFIRGDAVYEWKSESETDSSTSTEEGAAKEA